MYCRHGFSLMELLTALAMMALLSGFALFHAQDWILSKRAHSALNELRAMVNMARHTAIVRNMPVVLCPSARGPSAAAGCGPRNSWHNGMLAFIDADRSRSLTAADTVIASHPPLRQGRIYWRAFRSRSYLLFTPRGVTDWQNGHLLYCPDDGDVRFARQLVLNVAGRTYPSRDRDGDGIHEDVRGRPLRCP